MRIAICDDENSQISILENYINEITTAQLNVIVEDFYSGEELLKQFTLEKIILLTSYFWIWS